MRAYVITTGIIFAIIAAAHVYEVLDRGHVHHSDVLVVGVSVALGVWAWRLMRKAAA